MTSSKEAEIEGVWISPTKFPAISLSTRAALMLNLQNRHEGCPLLKPKNLLRWLLK